MARRCRLRNIVICVCTPCVCLVLLITYMFVMISLNMNSLASRGAVVSNSRVNQAHFKAPGSLSQDGFAPSAKTFWDAHMEGNALWNQLQQTIDRHFNPILHPNKSTPTSARISSDEVLLQQSFSEVSVIDNTKTLFDNYPQQIQQFVSYMLRRDYPVLIQPNGVCGAKARGEKERPLILFAIKTTEFNFKNRQAIRKTWGKEGWVAGEAGNSSQQGASGGYVRRVFLLGKEDTGELGTHVADLLAIEGKTYGDILQWDFRDTFFNLTLKDVLFWSWFSRNCCPTHFVFKGDDDVFVNTPKLITYLQEQLENPTAQSSMEDFMVGDVIAASEPNRDKTSKYFIPHTFYRGLYPMYAGGGGVVYSGQLAKRLHDISKTVHLFPIDDVYVGMCMIWLNALPVHHPAFLTFDFPQKELEEPCTYHAALLVHKRTPEQVVGLWADLRKTWPQCRDVPLRGAVDANVSTENVGES